MSTIEKALQKRKSMQSSKDKTTIEAAAEKTEQDKTLEVEATKSTEEVNLETKAETKVKPKVASKTKKVTKPTKSILKIPRNHTGFVSNTGRQVINEEFRAVKRKILSNAFGPISKTLTNSNIVMVSSPNPNEGKTFTAINLALSIAYEQDKTVLLVDADVLRPSVMNTIEQPFENGLMEYLLGEVDDLGEVIYNTDLDTLRIIPAGKTHHLSTELLASEKMLETVNEFATRYPDRVVIIDTPPLLGINETVVLANLAGQAVIVVQEGKTSLTRISQAVEHLSPDMAKGFVINKARKSASKEAGYYGYYYGSEE